MSGQPPWVDGASCDNDAVGEGVVVSVRRKESVEGREPLFIYLPAAGARVLGLVSNEVW